jgi:hypothetical protein
LSRRGERPDRGGKAGSTTDDARRVLTDEERVRAQLARVYGLVWGACGTPLVEGQTVWIERLGVGPTYSGRGAIYWRAPVCGACVSPAFRAVTEATEPERCAGCGRGMYYQVRHPQRRVALCSKWCGGRVTRARAKEARDA